MRVIGYQATLCFHCAMTALNLEALGEGGRVAGAAPGTAGRRGV